jgi:rubrerythrin
MTRTPQGIEAALIEAIEDEYRAKAVYQAAIAKFGPIAPFSRIADAEARHAAALVPLFEKHGLPVPADRFAGQVQIPETIEATCQLGVDAEIRNAAMYERLSANVQDPDARAVFARLASASGDNHLAAFQSCAGTTGTTSTATAHAGGARRVAGHAAFATRPGTGRPVPPAGAPLVATTGVAALRTARAGSSVAALAPLLLGVAAGAALVWLLTRRRG